MSDVPERGRPETIVITFDYSTLLGARVVAG